MVSLAFHSRRPGAIVGVPFLLTDPIRTGSAFLNSHRCRHRILHYAHLHRRRSRTLDPAPTEFHRQLILTPQLSVQRRNWSLSPLANRLRLLISDGPMRIRWRFVADADDFAS